MMDVAMHLMKRTENLPHRKYTISKLQISFNHLTTNGVKNFDPDLYKKDRREVLALFLSQ